MFSLWRLFLFILWDYYSLVSWFLMVFIAFFVAMQSKSHVVSSSGREEYSEVCDIIRFNIFRESRARTRWFSLSMRIFKGLNSFNLISVLPYLIASTQHESLFLLWQERFVFLSNLFLVTDFVTNMWSVSHIKVFIKGRKKYINKVSLFTCVTVGRNML
jgi:hypothetical protein